MDHRVDLDQETVIRPLLDLVGREVPRVRASFIDVALSWPERHYLIVPRSEGAVSQNGPEEAITVGLEAREGPFPEDAADTGTAGRTPTGLWVAETLLFFTDEVCYTARHRAADSLRFLASCLGWLLRGRPREAALSLGVGAVAGTAVSISEGGVGHPDRIEELRGSGRPVNLVQAGVVLDFDGACVPAFSDGNGFGFPIEEARPSLAWSEIRDRFGGRYRFVRVEGA
ncbi:MAG: hypothetical protein GWM92_10745 [Gemmatimonadetes bacterium]|nr:hypothetical protein [Gemmatimonadota bacterium]NIR79174.1 hypothetical protein [Gemmatimonadota bacterium]NIT87829.1 hypothetical protein [Gemmatimonadota bacterium]NIU31690.1 hypothetical protein [Gemmatimonadota bacterium]NIU36309.1 hypothetical protein [Gemmatimonadota bacterium]